MNINQNYDLYAVANCDSVPELFDSNNEYCSDISEVCELFGGDMSYKDALLLNTQTPTNS